MGRLTALLPRCLPAALWLAASGAWGQTPTQAPPASDGATNRSLTVDDVFGGALRAYHHALLTRRLGQQELRLEDVAARVAEGEQLTNAGRVDEAIARLAELVEHPQFELFGDTQ